MIRHEKFIAGVLGLIAVGCFVVCIASDHSTKMPAIPKNGNESRSSHPTKTVGATAVAPVLTKMPRSTPTPTDNSYARSLDGKEQEHTGQILQTKPEMNEIVVNHYLDSIKTALTQKNLEAAGRYAEVLKNSGDVTKARIQNLLLAASNTELTSFVTEKVLKRR
jgi:hypothetical protein